MNAFDQLQRQLSDSVAARRRTRRTTAIGGIGRWWRARVGPGAPAAAFAALLLLLAVGGFPHAGRGGGTETATLEGPWRTGAAEGSCPPCQAVGGRLHGPIGEAASGSSRPGRATREVLVRRGIPTVLWAGEMRSLR